MQLADVDDLEYFELVDPDTLEPVTTVERPVLVAVAARVGKTRLIDNAVLSPYPARQEATNPTPSSLTTEIPTTENQGAAA
jgi:hypothetical protein